MADTPDTPPKVLFEERGPVAVISLNRPEKANAQDSDLLYQLDDAFARFAHDDNLKVGILRGNGQHFSAGHDLSPEGLADCEVSYPRRSLWWDHAGKIGADNWLSRESEVYLGLCRRWRDLPKPTIAMVDGACIAAGLMLAWSCDIIVASERATFADPVIRMGVPGVELFNHPWEMGSRRAKEFLFLGESIDAATAMEWGMLNHLWPSEELEERTMDLARRIAEHPRFALALTKMAVNKAEEAMGIRTGGDIAFLLHQLAHVQNLVESDSPRRGMNVAETRDALRAADARRTR
jgi:Enoyl-CoA hydratase/carnithine racemase